MTVHGFFDQTAGACSHPAVDARLFFPDPDADPHDTALDTQDALELCRTCPIRDACLTFAMTQPQEGIWGGTTTADRRALARRNGQKYQPREAPAELFLSPHGSAGAYRRHTRRGEPPCTVCAEAEDRRRSPDNPNGYRGSWYRPWAS